MLRFFIGLVIVLWTPVFAWAGPIFDRIEKTGTLKCGYIVTEGLQKNPNTGAIEGIIPDILAETARLLNLKIDWAEELNWGNFTEALKSGRIDAICTNFWMEPNASKYVAYTIPLYYSGLGVYVRADDNRFSGDNLDALNDPKVRVSTMEGEMSGVIADQDYPQAQKVVVMQLGDSSQLLMDIVSNKADVAFLDVAIGKRFERNNPGKVKNLVPNQPVRVFGNTIALPPNEPQIKTMFDATFAQLLNGTFVDRVLKKHIDISEGYYSAAKPYGAPQ